jgi:hypothetical protein
MQFLRVPQTGDPVGSETSLGSPSQVIAFNLGVIHGYAGDIFKVIGEYI